MNATRRGRLRRVLSWAGRGIAGIGLLVVFALGLAIGLGLHLDLPVSRRVATRLVNALLGGLFEGRFEVAGIERLGLGQVVIGSVDMWAPDGSQVLHADQVKARPSAFADLMPGAWAGSEIRLGIEHIHIDRGELWLRPTASGELSVVAAFRLRNRPTEPEVPSPVPEAPSHQVVLSMPQIEVGAGLVHANFAGAPPFEGEARRVAASLVVGPGESLVLDVDRVGVAERGLPTAEASGSAAYHLRLAPVRMWGDFAGQVGGVDVLASGQLAWPSVSLTVDFPRIAPKELDVWLPGQPLQNPVAGRVSVYGTLPELELEGQFGFPRLEAGAERGELDANGRLVLGAPAMLDLLVRASSIDTRTFGTQGWFARVGGWARVLGRFGEAAPQFRVLFAGQGTASPGGPIPPIEGTVLFDLEHVVGWLHASEPGSPVDLWAQYGAADGLQASVAVDAPRVEAVPRLAALLRGQLGLDVPRGHAQIRARGRWLRQRLDGDFSAGLGPLAWAGVGASVHDAELAGTLEGPIDALALNAALSGHGLTVRGHQVSRFRASAEGPVASPALELSATDSERRELRAQAVLEPSRGALRQVRLRLDRDGTVLDGRVASIETAGGKVTLAGIELQGLGQGPLQGQLRIAGRDLTGRLHAEGVQLEPLRQLLGLPYPVRGTADLDLDLSHDAAGRQGHIRVALHDGGVLVVSGVQVEAQAVFDGDRVRPEAKIALTLPGSPGPDSPADGGAHDSCGGTIASVGLSDADAVLRGPLLDAATYLDATGKGSIRAPGIRLACVGQILAMVFYSGKQAPLEELSGLVDLSIDLERATGSRYPSLRDLRLVTKGLRITPRHESGQKPAWSTDGLDVDFDAKLDGATGDASANLALLDPTVLTELTLRSRLDLDSWLGVSHALGDPLRDTALSAELHVPRRPWSAFAALPEPLRSRLPPVQGDLQLDASLEGTMARPIAAARLRGWNVAYQPAAAGAASSWSVPVDFDLTSKYSERNTSLDASFVYRGATVATGAVSLQGDLPTWLRGRPSPDPWRGSVSFHLDRLPLAAFPSFSRSTVKGTVTGQLSVDGLGTQPRVSADFQADGLAVGKKAVLDGARLTLRSGTEHDARTVVLDSELRAQGGGRLGVTAYGDLAWDRGWIPSLDRKAPADLVVRLKAFPLSVARPFVSQVVSRLDGRLDGDLRLQWHQVAAVRDADLAVDLTLRDGVVHVPQLGQELRGIGAHVVSAPGGVLKVENFVAAPATGQAKGWLTARLDGFNVQEVSGELDVAPDEDVPITFEGVSLGTAHGRVLAHAVRQGNEIALALTGKEVHVTLPSSTTQAVQPLRDNPDVAILQLLGPPKAAASPSDLTWNITLGLTDTELEGTGLKLVFSSSAASPPRVHIGSKLEMTGELNLQQGEVDFLGLGSGAKLFQLDHGLVRFRPEEPSNPYVNIAAHYDASDGSSISCAYVGVLTPVTRDKLHFSSSPPRTQEEIIALLLFGESTAGSSATGTARQAGPVAQGAAPGAPTATGGGIGTYQLNALLGGIASLRGLSTSFGTTDEGFTSTGVAYQVTDTVTAGAAYETRANSGTPGAAGAMGSETSGQQSSSASRTRVGIDWRFYQDFLLRGSIGIGDEPTSGLDLMWQYRY